MKKIAGRPLVSRYVTCFTGPTSMGGNGATYSISLGETRQHNILDKEVSK